MNLEKMRLNKSMNGIIQINTFIIDIGITFLENVLLLAMLTLLLKKKKGLTLIYSLFLTTSIYILELFLGHGL